MMPTSRSHIIGRSPCGAIAKDRSHSEGPHTAGPSDITRVPLSNAEGRAKEQTVWARVQQLLSR